MVKREPITEKKVSSSMADQEPVEVIEVPAVLKRFDPAKMYFTKEVCTATLPDGQRLVVCMGGTLVTFEIGDKTYELKLTEIAGALWDKIK